MIIAVDFDGTIVEHKFPNIGSEMPRAIRTLQDLSLGGHKIIIWTCRSGEYICDMLKWLGEHNFVPDAVNANLLPVPGFAVPKILADMYIDDRNLGGFPGWDEVKKQLLG